MLLKTEYENNPLSKRQGYIFCLKRLQSLVLKGLQKKIFTKNGSFFCKRY